MKTNKCIIILVLLLTVGLSGIRAQSRQERKEQRAKAVKEQILSENYKIDVTMANPRRGKSIPLSSAYSLQIRNDSVISYLPFYGRAYSIPYGGGDGLNFKAPIDDYEMVMDKKGAAKIEFTARTNEDKFKYNVTVYSNGSAHINVDMQNRESISFTGDLE